MTTERTTITDYFYLGLRYSMILQLLSKYHDIKMSKSTLKRRLKEYNLKKHNNVPIEFLHTIIQREVREPATSFGYRKMQRYLRSRYKLNMPRDNIMNISKEVDPEAMEICWSCKLCCRKYISPGPDHCWHKDGYDKLKPFGQPILCSNTASQITPYSSESFLCHYGGKLKTAVKQEAGEKIDWKR